MMRVSAVESTIVESSLSTMLPNNCTLVPVMKN